MKFIETTKAPTPSIPREELPGGEECARLLMETVPRVMRSIRSEMRTAAQGSFTVPQFRILNRLLKAPQTNRDLADWMGVTPPTMSRMIDALLRRGLVEKAPDPLDMRSQSIELTLLGRQETTQTRAVVRSRIAVRLASLQRSEASLLMRGMEVLRETFK